MRLRQGAAEIPENRLRCASPEDGPCALERSPCCREIDRGAVGSVAGIASRIEAAAPGPLVAAGRIARSHVDRADVQYPSGGGRLPGGNFACDSLLIDL